METEKQEVVIVDLKMPFMSMVVFMVKWAIAAMRNAGHSPKLVLAFLTG